MGFMTACIHPESAPPTPRLNPIPMLHFFKIYSVIVGVFLVIMVALPGSFWQLLLNFGAFALLGLCGALVANSTGAGGGVVFIPLFDALHFSEVQAVATSMAIQCCGMPAGSWAWLRQIELNPDRFQTTLPEVRNLMLVSGPATVLGVLLAQYALPPSALPIATLFRGFSVFFGMMLLFQVWRVRSRPGGHTGAAGFEHLRTLLLALTALLGGVITAWISVGVGELVALLLIFLGFPALLSVAIGVYTSALSVLVGVMMHLWHGNVVQEVWVFAGLAAIAGGLLARHIATYLGPTRLKIFFAMWIIVTGLIM